MREQSMSLHTLCVVLVGVVLIHNADGQDVTTGQDICDQSYMGREKTGILSSDNYPFNYRLQRHCRHRIYLEDGTNRPNQTVCVTFNRFQVEYSYECRMAYMAFPLYASDDVDDIRYCGEGEWSLGPSTDPRSNIFTPSLCWLVASRWSTAFFDINFVGNYMKYKGYYGRFELVDVFSTIPTDSYLVTHNGIVRTADLDLVANDVIPIELGGEPRTLCSVAECPESCSKEFVQVDGCLVCVCREEDNQQGDEVRQHVTLHTSASSSSSSTSSSSAPCTLDEYTCFNRECIPETALCDGTMDCADGSDEDFKHARCPNAKQSIEACNFEAGRCEFSLRNMVIVSESAGGPRYDHSYDQLREDSNGGLFVQPTYITELTADMNYQVVPIQGSIDRCLSFWYFMSGLVGTLSVYIRVDTAGGELIKPPAWWRMDNYGNTWRQGEVDIPHNIYPLLEVRFHTIEGEDPYSHIALDDISMKDGKCTGYDPSCSFELGFCGWELDLTAGGGGALWERRRGPGASRDKDTGPEGDARTGDGFYLYMQSSLYPTGTMATVRSRTITYNPEKDNLYCVQLAYHMYGSAVDELSVWVHHHDNRWTQIESVIGNKGDTWNKLQLLITPSDVNGPFQIGVMARVGVNASADIAVDDVIITQGTCLTEKPETSTPPRTTMPPPLQCPPGFWLCHSGDECIPQERVCDGRLDCSDLSDEKDCSTGGQAIGLWIGTAMTILLLIISLGTYIIYKVKYKHTYADYDRSSSTSSSPPMTSYPPHFLMDNNEPQVFDDDFEEMHGSGGSGGGFHVSTFRPEALPPYANDSALPSYSAPNTPPPQYSVSRAQGTNANHQTVGESSTVTVSVTYPHEPPPSYEIAIVARPQMDPTQRAVTSGIAAADGTDRTQGRNATAAERNIQSRSQPQSTQAHDRTADSIQSLQPQISVRIASSRSRSASRDTLNSSASDARYNQLEPQAHRKKQDQQGGSSQVSRQSSPAANAQWASVNRQPRRKIWTEMTSTTHNHHPSANLSRAQQVQIFPGCSTQSSADTGENPKPEQSPSSRSHVRAAAQPCVQETRLQPLGDERSDNNRARTDSSTNEGALTDNSDQTFHLPIPTAASASTDSSNQYQILQVPSQRDIRRHRPTTTDQDFNRRPMLNVCQSGIIGQGALGVPASWLPPPGAASRDSVARQSGTDYEARRRSDSYRLSTLYQLPTPDGETTV